MTGPASSNPVLIPLGDSVEGIRPSGLLFRRSQQFTVLGLEYLP